MINTATIPPEMVLEIRRVTQSKGYVYLKDCAELMADNFEGKETWTQEGREKLLQAALFRKTIRGLWKTFEAVGNLETGKTEAERQLVEALTTQEVIEEVKS